MGPTGSDIVSEDPRSPGNTRPDGDAVPSVSEALSRAGRHARNAVSESILAVRALLDAISLLQGGAPAASNRALEQVAVWLEQLAAGVAGDGGRDESLTRALAEALDLEIERWERRAREDPDARAVLRAFLGVRELLWELGIRPQPKRGAPEETRPASKRKGKGTRRRRVERVPILSDPPDTLG